MHLSGLLHMFQWTNVACRSYFWCYHTTSWVYSFNYLIKPLTHNSQKKKKLWVKFPILLFLFILNNKSEGISRLPQDTFSNGMCKLLLCIFHQCGHGCTLFNRTFLNVVACGIRPIQALRVKGYLFYITLFISTGS